MLLNLNRILEEKDIGVNYLISGKNYTLLIKPIDSEELNNNSTNIDFSECEKKLREENNILDTEILTVTQLEINNADNSKLLTNQVEYQIYDENKKPLNMSICKDSDIIINYLINEDSFDTINKEVLNEFKNSGINVFNIHDRFFMDYCKSYSYKGDDLILEDRYNFIYQNYSFCEKIVKILKLILIQNLSRVNAELNNK